MKRYLVFAGEDYYPVGGAGDFVSDHDTEEEAIKVADEACRGEWAHVLDTETGLMMNRSGTKEERQRWGAEGWQKP